MNKYSARAEAKIEQVMHEYKEEKLTTNDGNKVTSHKQAVAIGISEAKKQGLKVPKPKKG